MYEVFKNEKGNYGVKYGNTIIVEPSYDEIVVYPDDGYVICSVQGIFAIYRMSDEAFEKIIPLKWKVDNFLFYHRIGFKVHVDDKWGFIALNGTVLLPFEYEKISITENFPYGDTVKVTAVNKNKSTINLKIRN